MMASGPQNGFGTPSGQRKISPPNFGFKNSPHGGAVVTDAQGQSADPDPGQLLNEWLGELDNLQKVSLF